MALRYFRKPFFLIIAIMATLVFVDKLLLKKEPAPRPTPGWQTIRPPRDVYALAIQGETVWTGGKDGLYEIDRKSGAVIKKVKCEPSLTYIKALAVDRSGALWIGHDRGLSRYDGRGLVTYTRKDGIPDDRVNALLEDRAGRLWVGTWSGATVSAGGGWKALTSRDGLADDMVNVILEDSDGGMWFGSHVAPRGGISYLKDGKWRHFTAKNGLPHNNINSLFEDSSGTVWAGTGLLDRGGAAQFKRTGTGPEINKTMAKSDGLAGEKVRSIFQDRDGVFWFASEYDGLARLKGGRSLILTEKDGLSHSEVKVMLQDEDGDLWLGTRDGVTRIARSALRSLP